MQCYFQCSFWWNWQYLGKLNYNDPKQEVITNIWALLEALHYLCGMQFSSITFISSQNTNKNLVPPLIIINRTQVFKSISFCLVTVLMYNRIFPMTSTLGVANSVLKAIMKLVLTQCLLEVKGVLWQWDFYLDFPRKTVYKERGWAAGRNCRWHYPSHLSNSMAGTYIYLNSSFCSFQETFVCWKVFIVRLY